MTGSAKLMRSSFHHFCALVLLGVMSLCVTGCKKCTTCTVTFQGVESSDEKCGNSEEVGQFKDDCKASAALLRSTDPDAKCTCAGS
jgi:hypothetical protein